MEYGMWNGLWNGVRAFTHRNIRKDGEKWCGRHGADVFQNVSRGDKLSEVIAVERRKSVKVVLLQVVSPFHVTPIV